MGGLLLSILLYNGPPRRLNGKESACQCRRHRIHGFESWVRKVPWRRKWQPSPVFLPGEFYWQGSLVDYSRCSCKESDMTECTCTLYNILTKRCEAFIAAICQGLLPGEEKAMAPHSSTLAWKIPWMEEPGGLQSMGSLRVGHDWVTSLSLFLFKHWRRKWQPTPVFLPGETQGRQSLVGTVYGVTQRWTQLKWLSSSSCQEMCGKYAIQTVPIYLPAIHNLLHKLVWWILDTFPRKIRPSWMG